MDDVSIEYCANYGQLSKATTTQRLLLDWLTTDECGVSLQPCPDPAFRVRVGDEVVWSVDSSDHVDPVAAVNAVQRAANRG
ncbi:Rdx family protein [Halomarina litorea]|uniref:Rdx family protein n=1 Tax=Halomarina litorea TaxID=2961595 RepID=UPI0020C3878A|nr:Rdx family protein [Halomarina sp. BCD28]